MASPRSVRAHQRHESPLPDDVAVLPSSAPAEAERDDPAGESASIDEAIEIYRPTPAQPISFTPPSHPTKEESALIADIVILDHLSLRTFNPKSPSRAEVWGLLINAIVAGLQLRQPADGQRILAQARATYREHLQALNRLLYLSGVAAGSVGLVALAALVLWISRLLMLPLPIRPDLLIGIFAFAGMGALASVLSRLSSLDLGAGRNRMIVGISGASRPVVAFILAIVIYIILALGIVNIQLGTNSGETSGSDGVYLLAAFLSGFSERFAQDIIARVPFGRVETDSGHGK